jgi:hypothetical protein
MMIRFTVVSFGDFKRRAMNASRCLSSKRGRTVEISFFQGFIFRIVLFLMLACFAPQLKAQSEAEILEQCVAKYNELNLASDRINQKPDKLAFADSLYEAAQQNRQRLALIIASNDTEIARCAKYFYMNSKYQFAFAYGAAGSPKKSLQYLEDIEKEMEQYTESSFPIRYVFQGKNYVIHWSNFAPTKAEYYIGLGELLHREKNSLRAKTVLEKAIPLEGKGTWLNYILYDYLIRTKLAIAEYDELMVKYCATQLSSYYQLDEESLKIVSDNQYSTYKKAISGIDECIDRGPLSQEGHVHLRTAIDQLKYYVDPLKEKDESTRIKNKYTLLRWYDTAINAPFVSKEYIKTAFTFALYNAPDETSAMSNWLNRYASLKPECNEYTWLMEAYRSIGNEAEANALTPKMAACEELKRAEDARLEKERRESEARNAKLYKRSSRKPLIYLGGNVFPFFTKPKDYGFALNIGGKALVVELSYLKVNEKPENYFDLSLRDISDVPEHRWDGYFAHVNFKFPMDEWDNGQARSYAGFLLAYNERKFMPFMSNVWSAENIFLQTEQFKPSSKQYVLMGNLGFMGVAGFGLDLFFGAGVAYNQFNGNSSSWNNADFVIEDAMMANRRPDYFSFSMRMGMSIGIGWAKP